MLNFENEFEKFPNFKKDCSYLLFMIINVRKFITPKSFGIMR